MFMNRFRKDHARHKSAIYDKESFLPPRFKTNTHIVDRNKRYHNRLGVTQYRAKPMPDPDREHETTWMTSEYLDSESEKMSKQWIEAGTDGVGKIFIEILGCDNLKNLDFSITGRNQSDPYVCIVHEDSIVNTDIIANCLNPRWLPWTQRAFILNMMHPSSQVFLGVFDNDAIGKNDMIGRAVINVSNFRPMTTYRLKYDLHALVKSQREVRGSITLRVRVHFPDERKALFKGAFPPTRSIDLSVAEKHHFRTVNYTLANEVSLMSGVRLCVSKIKSVLY